MSRVFSRQGQNLVDLALIISVVGLVFIGMNTYIKRGIQGKAKDFTDYIVSSEQSAGDAVDRTSHLHVDSNMTDREFVGGARLLTGTESSQSDYSQ